jgi:hypothetical protein
MPTLRKFFKHLMPRIMGSYGSASYDATYGQQQSGGLSRGRKQRSHYSQFPEDDETELRQMSADTKNGGTVAVHAAGSPDGQRDDHSERAILRTQSFIVQYDARSGSEV